MIFSYTTHKGIAPKIAEHLLPNGYAVTAENCNIDSGELRPLQNNQYSQDLISTTAIGTIYFYLGQYWFEFPAGVDIQEAPVINDTENRIYWTGNGIPKKTNQSEATTGSGAYPINYYPMSVPTPDHAITAALGAGGTGDNRDVSYVWTIVTSWGEEGMPSDPSNIVSAKQGQTVNLSGMSMIWAAGHAYEVNSWVLPAIADGYCLRCVTAGTSDAAYPTVPTIINSTVTDGTVVWRVYKDDILNGTGAEKRIYRSNTGSVGAVWSLVDTITIGTTTYADTKTDASLEQTILPSEDWAPPPDALSGLVAIGSFFAGFIGKDIYLSEPNRPHAWPYGLSVGHDIVALASFGNALVVLTERNPVIFTGTHPDSMTPKKLGLPKKCLSKSGVVVTDKGVLYPSAEGLELINGTSVETITRNLFTKDEWSDYYPSTFIAAFHKRRYHGFYSSGGQEGAIVIDLDTGDITTLDLSPAAVYVDPGDDTLYFVDSFSYSTVVYNGEIVTYSDDVVTKE